MKTIILKSQNEQIKAEVKVDIFATNDEMDQPGFDTRFTGMEVVAGSDSIIKGVDVTLIEYSWQSIVSLAKQLGLGLYVVDINDTTSNQSLEVIAPPAQDLTPFVATSNTGDASTSPDLGPLDVTYYHDGSSVTPQVGDTIYQDPYGQTTLDNVGASADHIQLGNGDYLQTNGSGVFTEII